MSSLDSVSLSLMLKMWFEKIATTSLFARSLSAAIMSNAVMLLFVMRSNGQGFCLRLVCSREGASEALVKGG